MRSLLSSTTSFFPSFYSKKELLDAWTQKNKFLDLFIHKDEHR
jgi:hypothetical protein